MIHSAVTKLSWHVCEIHPSVFFKCRFRPANWVNWLLSNAMQTKKKGVPVFQDLSYWITYWQTLRRREGGRLEEEERDITQQLPPARPAHCQERLDTPRVRGHSSSFIKLRNWAQYLRVVFEETNTERRRLSHRSVRSCVSIHMPPIMAWNCDTGVWHIYIDSLAEVYLVWQFVMCAMKMYLRFLSNKRVIE